MSDATSPHFQEWLQARGVIAAADTNLDSVRKLGISLVTGLLTADAFLLPGHIAGVTALPEPLKFGVLLATLLLLGAVAVIDRNYNVLQQAAASRARIIENELNLGLTESISKGYAQKSVDFAFHFIYVLIGGALLVLGYFVLDPSYWFWSLLAIWAGWSSLTLLLITARLYEQGGVNWSLDSTDITPGEIVHLTATNLYPEVRESLFPNHPTRLYQRYRARYEKKRNYVLRAPNVFWEIREASAESRSPPLREGRVSHTVALGPRQSFVWAIDTLGIEPRTVLSVLPREPYNPTEGVTVWFRWAEPLNQKIRLRPKSSQSSSNNHTTDS